MKITGRIPGELSVKIFAEERQKVTPVREIQASEQMVPEKESERKRETPPLDPQVLEMLLRQGVNPEIK